MWQYNRKLEAFADSELTPRFADIQRDKMCHPLGQTRCNLPSHCQYAAFNCFLVSTGDVSTAYNHIVHEERRIGAVCSRVLGLSALYRRVNPCWLDDMYHEIKSAVVVREVSRLGDDVIDVFEILYSAFGSIEGYDGAARVGYCKFNLSNASVTCLSNWDASRTSRKRSSERPFWYIVKLNSSKSPWEPSSMVVSSMAVVERAMWSC